MQLCHVVPKDSLGLSCLGDFDFCLAHLALTDENYKRFFINCIKRGREVYLDNGVWETGFPLEPHVMIQLAVEMHPTYVYASDYMNDSARSIEAAWLFGEESSKNEEFASKIICVAQGKTRNDWFYCIEEYSQFPPVYCDTIAVNTLFLDDMFEYEKEEGARRSKTRLSFLIDVQHQLDRFKHKRFYATGFGAAIDAKELTTFPFITGVDTAIACAMAKEGKLITYENSNFYKPKVKVDKLELDEYEEKLAILNMKRLNTWAKGGE